MVWSQLELEKPHIAYACVGVFCIIFSLVSLFVKERLYIGEASVATIAGLILGPHCLNWFDPDSWGNSDFITLEICRIVLCIQIVAVAVELPRKYMKKHWVSVAIFLLPVMTCGWLVVGLFIWALIPHFSFNYALLVSACVTATDPVLASAVVGKGKFAERVPGHLRNLLTAESGCNDGMAFPFIYLSINLIIHSGHGGEIVKDWILITILYECVFGCLLGVFLGLLLKYAVAFAEKKNLIDRESFLALFVFLAFISAGIGSMLGVDDLLVSFAAGTAFGWNGYFARKTEESHVSTVIDLLLNLSFFVYFGAIVPWPQFNNADIGLNCWRLIVLALVIIFLRRLPAVVMLKPVTPDVKTWREAFFCGHFGPIGVGAIFAAILARKSLEAPYTTEETPLARIPDTEYPHYQVLATIWPIVCFVVITSIIVHGSSVAVLTLGKRLNRMAITMSFTTTNTQDQASSWMSRLQKLDKASTSFSLHRVDTQVNKDQDNEKLAQYNSIETSGVKVRPAGGAKRRKHKKKKHDSSYRLRHTLSKSRDQEESPVSHRQRPQTEILQLGKVPSAETSQQVEESPTTAVSGISQESSNEKASDYSEARSEKNSNDIKEDESNVIHDNIEDNKSEYDNPVPTTAYQEGEQIIVEDQNGEIYETLPLKGAKKEKPKESANPDTMSIHSMNSLRRKLSQYSKVSEPFSDTEDKAKANVPKKKEKQKANSKTAYHKKDDPNSRLVYAHRVDNFIFIENADGEIIRRYRVNPHTKAKEDKSNQGINSVFNKAISLVGIKNKPKADENKNNTQQDLEKNNQNVLVPEHDEEDNNNHPLKDPKIESKIENKLTNLILNSSNREKIVKQMEDPKRHVEPHFLVVNPASEHTVSEPEDSDDDNEADTGAASMDSEDEDLHETEVERKRRLAALGHMPTKRDVNDEEE
ncbi:Piso0_002613 [Millerozyma farinosa CBS 7064]|uniref:Piso0_002613 protein n=2 Tax=Millerozyma farinosa TaxID=4920 RepID=G8YFI3_PICSO|nr:putative Na+/H+ antiporter [Millerozyma farinosa]CCE81932.1 Piso0_002613 [Millerozyma farinosa CBS 7064]